MTTSEQRIRREIEEEVKIEKEVEIRELTHKIEVLNHIIDNMGRKQTE